jgi:hypothetical protein
MVSEDLSCYTESTVTVAEFSLKWPQIEKKIVAYIEKESVKGKIYIIEHFCLFAQEKF